MGEGSQGAFFISFLHSIDDVFVLVDYLPEMILLTHGAKTHQTHKATKLPKESKENRKVCCASYREMKLFVQRDEFVLILGISSTTLANKQESQLVDVIEGHYFASLPHCYALE